MTASTSTATARAWLAGVATMGSATLRGGFKDLGRVREVGHELGRVLDVVCMQKIL